MEVFDLPTLDPDLGLSLVAGESFPSAVVSASAVGFPSLHTLPHTHAVLGYHHVNVHGTESRNQSIVVQIKNTYESRKTEDIGREVLGKRTFIGWPFLQEGMVVALSDELFRYEKVLVGGGVGSEKVIGTPHNQNGLGYWKSKADRIENVYSKRFGVVTGPVEVLLHVRPLKGLKRLEDGSFIKDYEGIDKETEAAVQMTISSSAGVEDPRFVERAAPKLEDEFPEGSRIFFLGEHAYGVAAQVSGTTDDSLSVVLAFFPSDTTENAQFKSIVNSETLSSTSPSQSRWHPAFTAASILNISNRALSKITSSFMIITSDGVKHNLGLSIKFEAKGLKVVGYSRKGNGNDGIRGGGARQNWEYSDKAIELIREYLNAFPEIFMCLDAGGDGVCFPLSPL
ncbi:hypothetical protein BT96DRAFT_832474 [Gymnopus androsaceus JB14]|uniref:Uncharacterized protein n=1 Tax=Gymnopus androsaceus JB14 TaxID=1447944 RepID=A0A6A4GZ03_9AGAR|nr:hypothetical protein BT96DRAFT_832474 [Gymnopus androsaceus JB14]